ncbi:MAG: GAF domain-containing protein [Deltaproteobacteria bacterium]|nr:MAG: GAF domain-containing protein [Deltaproteobacteria bacterium]
MPADRELTDITALLSNCLDAFTAALFVWDDRKRLLTMRAFHSLSKQIIPNVQFTPEDGGLVGWVAKSKQPLAIDHFDRRNKTIPYYHKDENIKSFLATPLGKSGGVLCVDSKRQYVFTNKDQKLLSGFATVVSNTLSGERTNRRQQLMRQLMTLWYRADPLPADSDDPVPYLTRLLDSARPYLRADAGLVAVPIKEGKFLQLVATSGEVPEHLLNRAQPTHQGIAGWIFQNRKSLVVPKFRSRTRIPFLFGPSDGMGKIGALIGMPLAWEADEVGGVICFIRRAEASWNREEIDAITSVVRRATLVLQNFSLRRELAIVRNLDPITEVCNAYAFDRVLNKRLQGCLDASVTLGLGIITIEGLEALSTKVALSDMAVLRQRVAAILLQRMKGKQLMGSLDPGRFAVLFEDETSGEIRAQLTDMTRAVNRELLERLEEPAPMHAFFGFALYPRDATVSRELWTVAFQALNTRRNSVSLGAT